MNCRLADFDLSRGHSRASGLVVEERLWFAVIGIVLKQSKAWVSVSGVETNVYGAE
jgi:hypothetical protein